MVTKSIAKEQLVVRVLFRDCSDWKRLLVASAIALRRAVLIAAEKSRGSMYLTAFQLVLALILILFIGWLVSGWLRDRAFQKGREKGFDEGVEKVTKTYGIVLPDKPKPFRRHGDL